MATNALNNLKSQLSGLESYQPEDEAVLRQRAENIYKPQYEQDLMSLKDSLNSQLATQARSALSNGMQRSSYNQAAQASIRGAGLRSEAQLGAAYEGNVGAALANMLDKEKDRKDAADQYRNNLLLQIYNLEQAGKKSKGSGNTNPPPVDTGDNKDKLYLLGDKLLDGLGNSYEVSREQGTIYKNGLAQQLSRKDGNWVSTNGAIPQSVINHATGLPISATPTKKTAPKISAQTAKEAEKSLLAGLSTTKKTYTTTKK